MNEHYVYVLLDPRKPGKYEHLEFIFDHEPFYVGMGTNLRIHQHELEAANLHRGRPSHKVNKIRKIIKKGLNIIKLKIIEEISYDNANEIESKLIEDIGTIAKISGIKRGTLTNQIAGGKNGKRPSKELRAYIGKRTSEALMSNQEARQKISATHKNKQKTKEHADKLRIHLSTKCNTEDQRKRSAIRQSLRERSLEERKKIADKVSEFNKDTVIINNEIVSKRIKKHLLEPMILEGWVHGRITKS